MLKVSVLCQIHGNDNNWFSGFVFALLPGHIGCVSPVGCVDERKSKTENKKDGNRRLIT